MATVTAISPGLAKVLPEKLTEARESVGLNMTELAEKLGVTRQAVSRYELGTLVPSPEIMSQLVSILGQPLFFFTSQRQRTDVAIGTSFFRSFKSATATSRKVCLSQKKWLIDAFNFVSKYINLPEVKIEQYYQEDYSKDDIEDIAVRCRRHWSLGDGPIGDLVKLLEANGFVVTRADFGVEKIDAFSFWYGERPFIFLSSDKSSAVRSRFDAAHELGHIVLHSGITPEQLEDPIILKRVEAEADQFAGRFLLPASSFPSEVFSSRLSNFIELKKRWKVSIAAMIYRCSDLALFSEEQVLNLRRQMSMNKMRTREPLDDTIPIERPTMLYKSIDLLVKNGLRTPGDIVREISLSGNSIERLCGLPTGSLEVTEQTAPPVRLTLRSV
jgi:Zn-dependent peptidase ImmA (M78 family)/transcriptional regulator with XRE-family HTH domain